MGLREHNADRLAWWLDGEFPDRIAGRMPPDTVLESRKLEGSVLLKKDAYNRVDDYYRLKHGVDENGRPLSNHARKWYERRVATDHVLLYLTDRYLRDKADNLETPEADRTRLLLIHRAMRHVCLSESAAGGMVELERLEKLGKHNHTIRTVAGFARAAIEEILDELDRRDFRLEVAEDKRSKDRYEAMVQDRAVQQDIEGSYRLLAEERAELTCGGMSSTEATEEVARRRGVAPSKVWRACKRVKEGSDKA